MTLFLLALCWIVCGFLAFGYWQGHFCRKFPMHKTGRFSLPESKTYSYTTVDPAKTYKENAEGFREFSLALLLFSPIALLVCFMSCDYRFKRPLFTIKDVERAHIKMGNVIEYNNEN